MTRNWKQVSLLALVGLCSQAFVADADARNRIFGRRRARNNNITYTTTTTNATVRGQTPEAVPAVRPATPAPPPNVVP